MNTLSLLQSGKRLIKSPVLDETDLTTETDGALPIESWVQWLNVSQKFHQNLVVLAAQDYFGATKTITFTSGTREYELPSDSLQVRLVERTDTDPDRILLPINVNERAMYKSENADLGFLPSSQYTYIWDNFLGITPTPTSGTASVLYIRRLPDLSYGTGTAAATTFTLATTPDLGTTSNVDDYYNNAYIYIVSATTGAGQTKKITDYVGSTRVATVTFPVTPTGTIVYSIVCEIPEQFHEAVYTYAAMLAKMSDDEDTAQLRDHHDRLIEQMVDGLIPRSSQSARYVINVP